MTLRLVIADMGHLWLHLEAKTRHVPAHEYRLLVAEVLRKRAHAAVDGTGTPCAIGGVCVLGDGVPGAAWLSVVPGGLGGRLVGVVAMMRRVLRAALPFSPEGLIAIVDDGNANGQRLARALGFLPTGDVVVGTSRRWIIAHGRHRRDDHGRRAAAPDEPRPRRAGGAAGAAQETAG